MKIFITNKDYFDKYPELQNKKNTSTKEIHKSLYNEVFNDFNVKGIIKTAYLISVTNNLDAIFFFEGKNKDMFFFSFNGFIN